MPLSFILHYVFYFLTWNGLMIYYQQVNSRDLSNYKTYTFLYIVSAKLMNRKSSVRGMTVMEVTTFCTEFICHVLLILTMKLSPCFNEQGLPLWKKFCLLGNAICANWFWGSSRWKGYEN